MGKNESDGLIGIWDDPKYRPLIREAARDARWYRYFNQGEHWVPNDRPPVPIADMPKEWRLNCLRYLERSAARYAGAFQAGCNSEALVWGISQFEMPEEVQAAMWREGELAIRDPLAWVRSTKLYRALADGLPQKGKKLRELGERASHWDGCPRREGAAHECRCTQLYVAEQQRKQQRELERRQALVSEWT